MARRPHELGDELGELPLEFVDDGLTDDERAAALARWLDEFDRRPVITVSTRAADTLAELRAEGEL